MPIDAFAAALLFAAIFVFGHRLHAIRSPRVALSVGAGATTAYVFVHMLPELSEASSRFVTETAGMALPTPELRVYMSALVGFVVFYGLEHLVTWSRGRRAAAVVPVAFEVATHPATVVTAAVHGSTATGFTVARPGELEVPDSFDTEHAHRWWLALLHIAGFAFYAWLVSYLMVRGITDKAAPIALYAVAMGLHFLGVDHSLGREHREVYRRVGRFVLAGAALAGWGVAVLTELSRPMVLIGLGFLSGGVVMNSMVMELPDEKDGRFWPFVLGAAAYTLVLALVR